MRKKKAEGATSSLNCCPCNKSLKNKPAWIACNDCGQWWHASCVNLTKQICSIFRQKNLPFTCPTCIVSKFNIDFHEYEALGKEKVVVQEAQSRSDKLIDEDKPESRDNDIDLISSSVEHGKGDSDVKNLLIIDGLKNPEKFQNSRDIQKEIRKHKGDIQMKYAYPLNRGGLVVQVETEEGANILKEEWPEEAFMSGGQISVHRSNYIPKCVFKNISLGHTAERLISEVEKQTGLSVTVRRLRYRDTGKPMPVAIVTCASFDDLQLLFKSKLSIDKKLVKIVPYQSKRFIPTRCFNCQEYGHVACLCKKEKKCEKCAENHTGKCETSNKCVNCGDCHPSSSLACPIYIAIKEKLRRRGSQI